MNFIATNLKPFCSNLLMISPMSPLCTPSGLIMIKVRSSLPAIFEQSCETTLRREIIDGWQPVTGTRPRGVSVSITDWSTHRACASRNNGDIFRKRCILTPKTKYLPVHPSVYSAKAVVVNP